MTEDYKEKMLKWFTGNYNIETGYNSPQFTTPTNRTNNFETEFTSLFPNGYFLNGALQGQDSNNNGVGYTILYGTYYTDETQETLKGFIVILDEDFDILQSITEYSSGTQFNIIEVLTVGDDGNFYGIENNGGSKRFIMLNNIIAKLPNEIEYKVVLRQSYNLSGQSRNIEYYTQLIKAPSQSKYLIVGTNQSQHIIATELTVNVGSQNDWIDYTYNANEFGIGDTFSSWDSDGNLTFKIAGFLISNSGALTYGELLGGTSIGQTMQLTTYGSEFQNFENYSVKKINLNKSYFSITYDDPNEDLRAYMEIYYVNEGSVYLLKSVYTVFDYSTAISLFKVGEDIFYIYDFSPSPGIQWLMIVGKLINENTYEQEISYFANHIDMSMFMVQKQFNLYDFFIQIGDIVYNTKQVYNSINYNGEAYQNINSMLPTSGRLYNNNNLIFARNLYNRNINNNTTVSILNVPNNFINNIEINKEELYSGSNNIISESNNSITTNIYEELMINFINTINMVNANDSENIIYNNNGATRLNNSISNPMYLDYEQAKATKIKINYSDNTNDIQNIVWEEVNNYYQAKILLYVNKEINNIQIISEDELTVYQTITNEFQIGSFYTINQDVWIIEKN